MERPAVNFGDIIEPLHKGGDKRIVKGRVRAKCSVDVTAHSIDIAVDGEEGGVMGATGDLLDEGGEGKGLGYCECFIVVLLANTRLSILVDSHEQELVDVHYSVVKFNIKSNITQ
jgi:hypothetical protein